MGHANVGGDVCGWLSVVLLCVDLSGREYSGFSGLVTGHVRDLAQKKAGNSKRQES